MDRVPPRSNTNEQTVNSDNQINRGNRFYSSGARRGQPNHQGITMDQIANLPESSVGRTPVSRSNGVLETALYPPEFYYPHFQANMDQPLTMTHDNHFGVEEESPMVNNAGNTFGIPDSAPRTGGYPSIGYPFRRFDYIAMENGFGLPAQGIANGYHPSNTAAAVSNPYTQDLQPGSHDIPTTGMHVGTTPESSTVPGYVPTNNSSSSISPDSSSSQEPIVTVWNPVGQNAPIGRNRKRRKMTDDELVRNRALKAAGGACDDCRRRKKRCHHKDDQLILSAPAPTPGPSQHVPAHVNNSIGTRTLHARPRLDHIRRGVTSDQHQQRNQSIASSNGRSADPSMFSPSDGGASSSGTMTSAQSNATTFAVDEYHPDMGVEEQFGSDTAGFGHQFNGQLATQFDPINIMDADNDIGFNYNWPDGDHSGEDEH